MHARVVATVILLAVSLESRVGHALDQEATPAPAPAVAEAGDASDHDPRRFSGLGFHMHMEIGPAYGQQALEVERVDARTVVTGDTTPADAVAGGPGAATRLELWPAYGRYAAIGVYGDAVAGGLRRQGGGTGMFAGSGGFTLMAGAPRFKLMVSIGRSRRASAYGTGTESVSDVTQLSATNLATAGIDANDHYTAGSSDVRSHRAGLGVRTSFDTEDRRGLDLWLLLDDPVRNDGPAIGLPDLDRSAVAMRTTLRLRNVLALTGEVTVRAAAPDESLSGTAIRERSAMVTLGWSMDRFSRPY